MPPSLRRLLHGALHYRPDSRYANGKPAVN